MLYSMGEADYNKWIDILIFVIPKSDYYCIDEQNLAVTLLYNFLDSSMIYHKVTAIKDRVMLIRLDLGNLQL